MANVRDVYEQIQKGASPHKAITEAVRGAVNEARKRGENPDTHELSQYAKDLVERNGGVRAEISYTGNSLFSVVFKHEPMDELLVLEVNRYEITDGLDEFEAEIKISTTEKELAFSSTSAQRTDSGTTSNIKRAIKNVINQAL